MALEAETGSKGSLSFSQVGSNIPQAATHTCVFIVCSDHFLLQCVNITHYLIPGKRQHDTFQQTQTANHVPIPFRRDWINKRGLNSKNLALVDVIGDSMEKVLREGDFVLIDLSQTEIVSGKAYVIRIGDELLVKYVQHLPGGLIQVFSENSTIYPPFTVSSKELGTEIFIIGRVVASAHMW
ncbi:hypothetical protein ES703_74273 [subsurface metagenome]